MLSMTIAAIVGLALSGVTDAGAQVHFAVTGGSGACASEANTSINTTIQEAIMLRGQITQAERLLDDISEMEACASMQMVWVSGSCISVESFRGEAGDQGPQGISGRDATCP